MRRLLLILAFIPLYLKGATDTLRVIDTSAMKDLYGVVSNKKQAMSSDGVRWEHRRIFYSPQGLPPSPFHIKSRVVVAGSLAEDPAFPHKTSGQSIRY